MPAAALSPPPAADAAGQPLAPPAPGPASATTTPVPRPSTPERPRSATPDPILPGRSPDLGDATTGTLRLVVVPPAEVTVDGRLVGTVSAQTLSLPPGRHVVRFLHPDYKPLQRTVTVRPGATVDLSIDLAEKAIPIPR
jgi:hypothetical protein